ncbi:MAG: NAD(P)H-dependent oxidoreductase [Gammaproteobacteria bacterium]|jgi:NAD(P)H dehydrogenase (quinone)|nr:NAD(P)H-dependent oxidoreductase [Gammaproteobacteria bacterium]MDP6616972.1 NAD(P)H-dependent oxidoreductase [Gammaproteobacteria bacterium]MDP6695136.1 NAD(P)H-dependent oxidoreductase [Gammaproteobacteria bacterium]MDP7041858.1 NAD(P)H-dependent oxidoreductase [Gammaproteobacteria bacterium]
MKVLVVYAHPEPDSYNGVLLAATRETLAAEGHELVVSDLYAQGFNAVAGEHDVTGRADTDRFSLGVEQMHAAQTNGFAADVRTELDKLMAADALILQFPMWWFSMPAIMKGWIDRVFACGVAYEHGRTWEKGVFVGRRAMIAMTVSAPTEAFLPDGKNGDMERVLWPVHAGVLALCGYSVLPPFVAHGIPFCGEEAMAAQLEIYRDRLRSLESTEPLFFHMGDDLDEYRLRPDVEPRTPGQHRGPRYHMPEPR